MLEPHLAVLRVYLWLYSRDHSECSSEGQMGCWEWNGLAVCKISVLSIVVSLWFFVHYIF